MRGYVERLEAIESGMPENQDATHEDVMDSYFRDEDTARDTDEKE